MATSRTGPKGDSRALATAPLPRPPQPIRARRIVLSSAAWAVRATLPSTAAPAAAEPTREPEPSPGLLQTLFATPALKYAATFAAGVFLTLSIVDSSNVSNKAFDDVTGLVGTVGQPFDSTLASTISVDELDVGAHREDLLGLARRANDPNRELGALTEACLLTTTGGLDMYSVAAVLQHGRPEFHVEPVPQWRAAAAWAAVPSYSGSSATAW